MGISSNESSACHTNFFLTLSDGTFFVFAKVEIMVQMKRIASFHAFSNHEFPRFQSLIFDAFLVPINYAQEGF